MPGFENYFIRLLENYNVSDISLIFETKILGNNETSFVTIIKLSNMARDRGYHFI